MENRVTLDRQQTRSISGYPLITELIETFNEIIYLYDIFIKICY